MNDRNYRSYSHRHTPFLRRLAQSPGRVRDAYRHNRGLTYDGRRVSRLHAALVALRGLRYWLF